MERKIGLPNRDGSLGIEELILTDNLVIVGSNGSGKSRLGSRIEQHTGDREVKRISAQRYLQFNDVAQAKTHTQSISELLTSYRNRNVIDPQNDYEIVLSSLFSQTAKRNEEYVALCKLTPEKPILPESSIERLQKIWNDIFPHRLLSIADNKVSVLLESRSYSAREMSDGEKVSLYLIAQTLILPENCLVIIDEPELHLHRSLMARLWNEIEQERSDCIFIYITHDLDFAASRVKAAKIWVKSYDEGKWFWELIKFSNSVPENLLLEIIGSRKPILFVEGERGSYDHAIYQFVYTNYTIIPRGNASKVIESVRAIRENPDLHAVQSFGLIDRDYKTDEEVEAISKQGLYILNFAEVENILLIPSLIKAVARNQALDEEKIFNKAKSLVLGELAKDFERIVSYRTSLIANFKLNCLDNKQVGSANIKSAISTLVDSINVDAIFAENTALYQSILEHEDYEGALKYYNNKGLISKVSKLLELDSGKYAKFVLRLLNIDDRKSDIIKALKNHLPEINVST